MYKISLVQISIWEPTIRAEKYHGFLRIYQICKRILPEIRLWTFNFGFFQIYYPLNILSIEAVQCKLLEDLLSKSTHYFGHRTLKLCREAMSKNIRLAIIHFIPPKYMCNTVSWGCGNKNIHLSPYTSIIKLIQFVLNILLRALLTKATP